MSSCRATLLQITNMSSIVQPEPTLVFPALHDASPVSQYSPTVGNPPPQARITSCSSFSDQKLTPLPPKTHPRLFRHARYTFLNVYRRLFSIVFTLNVVGVGILFWRYDGDYNSVFLGHLATAAAANIMVALLARQDYIVNAMFRYFYPNILSDLHV